jgi:hypothetical protein
MLERRTVIKTMKRLDHRWLLSILRVINLTSYKYFANSCCHNIHGPLWACPEGVNITSFSLMLERRTFIKTMTRLDRCQLLSISQVINHYEL